MFLKHNQRIFKGTIFLIQSIIVCLFLFYPFSQTLGLGGPDLKFSSSLNPVGSGARALGMGGAFIAVADDAPAASWNPAGVKHLLRPEVSLVGNYDHRKEGFSFSDSTEASKQYTIYDKDLNYMSVVYPFMWQKRNFVISLNYQNLYSLNRNMQFQYTYDEPKLTIDYDVTFKQEGNLKAISPALAVFLTPKLFFGMTLNFWSDDFFDNGWVEHYRKSGKGLYEGIMEVEIYTDKIDRYSFSGCNLKFSQLLGDIFSFDLHRVKDRCTNFNMNLGLLWDINRYITLGAVIKTPFTARFRHEGKTITHTIFPKAPEYDKIFGPATQTAYQTLTMPPAYGIGLAIKPSARRIIDLDIYRIEWDDYVLCDASGNKIDPITRDPKAESSLKATHHVRLGCEYVFLCKKFTLSPRLGLFYDPEPARNNPDDFYGFGLGAGITFGPLAVDWAYQYRFGKNVEGDSIKGEMSSADVKQHLFYNSIIYYF